MTGSAIVTINAAAQAGARAAMGPARVGEPSGFELLTGGVMLIGAMILLLEVAHLVVRTLWRGRR